MTLIQSVERDRLRHGFYPESVHVDIIYRTRENIRYCHKYGIRISGPKLGWSPKELAPAASKKGRQYTLEHICSEGKIEESKRRYGLSLTKEKL